MPRRKRVLDELPKAPPKPPRVPTQAELQAQVENDARLLEHLKYRLGPVLAELRKKFKKFTRDVWVSWWLLCFRMTVWLVLTHTACYFYCRSAG